jgi:hypothetical protein
LQIKTTLRFHLAPVRIAIIKNTTNKLYAVGCPLIFHSHLQKPLSSGFCPHQSMKTILSTIHHSDKERSMKRAGPDHDAVMAHPLQYRPFYWSLANVPDDAITS